MATEPDAPKAAEAVESEGSGTVATHAKTPAAAPGPDLVSKTPDSKTPAGADAADNGAAEVQSEATTAAAEVAADAEQSSVQPPPASPAAKADIAGVAQAAGDSKPAENGHDEAPKAEPRASEAAAGEPPAASNSAAPALGSAEADTPAKAAAASEGPSASSPAAGTASGAAESSEETPAKGTVQELSKRLSSITVPDQATPVANGSPPASKEPSVTGRSGGLDAVGAPAAPASPLSKTPSMSQRTTAEAVPLSNHDTKNTVNASQLLKLGAFKMQPLKDFVPYEELLKLRLEDGIDATRREDYLSEEDFKTVFEISRDAFRGLPPWKQQMLKKRTKLF